MESMGNINKKKDKGLLKISEAPIPNLIILWQIEKKKKANYRISPTTQDTQQIFLTCSVTLCNSKLTFYLINLLSLPLHTPSSINIVLLMSI